jgi:hypothetical protein
MMDYLELSPAPRAGNYLWDATWGSAALHPRLYAVACSAAWPRLSFARSFRLTRVSRKIFINLAG